MRQPLMAVFLLFLCFPVKGVIVMLAAAALGAAIPLPKAFRKEPRRLSKKPAEEHPSEESAPSA